MAILDAFFHRITFENRVFLARQLATMLSSGLPLDESLKTLTVQADNLTLKQSLSKITSDIEEGLPLSVVASRHPEIFDRLFVAMVKAGETSGKLDEVLLEIADYLEKERAIRSSLRAALVYPIFLISAMILVGGLLMVRVIPNLTSIFSEAGLQLPLSTRIVIGVASLLKNWWWLILAGLALASWFVSQWLKTPAGRLIWDSAILQIPVLKKLVVNLTMLRFSRSLGALVAAGVPILDSLKITAEILGNQIYQERLAQVARDVERGVPMSVPLTKSPQFPALVPQMLRVGERTGRLDEILLNLAKYFDHESQNQLKALFSLFEPVIIVLIGLGVAIMVFAVFLPIYQIVNIE